MNHRLAPFGQERFSPNFSRKEKESRWWMAILNYACLRVQDISLLDRPEQALPHYPIPTLFQLQQHLPLIMTQQLNLGPKLRPLILCSIDHSTSYVASVPSHPCAQKCYSASFDSAPPGQIHPQEDYPDGGLQAWLVVLGVRLSV